jgi:hypothetical protein
MSNALTSPSSSTSKTAWSWRRGGEPTAAEVAEHVGPLGRLMAAEGLQAKLTGTGNNKTRRYTFELKEKIEALLDSGEVE